MQRIKKQLISPDKHRKNRKGALLIAYAFVTMSVLATLAYGLSKYSNMDNQIAENHQREIQAYLAAQSGLEYALDYYNWKNNFSALQKNLVYLHNFGANYGNAKRYVTSFKLSESSRTITSTGQVWEYYLLSSGAFDSSRRRLLAEVQLVRQCSTTKGKYQPNTFKSQ
ncbi:hypothetical protein ACFL35_11095 [Candidatus Riflebacteria bacterium]